MTALSVQTKKEASTPSAIQRATLSPFQLMRSLMNWDPFQELVPVMTSIEPTFLPGFEVRENKDGYLFKADVPGIKEADISITITGNQLVVSGKREAEEKREDENYYLHERSYGNFSRTFTLPDSADGGRCGADLKDGVLTIQIPKEPEAQPKKVSVSTAKA